MFLKSRGLLPILNQELPEEEEEEEEKEEEVEGMMEDIEEEDVIDVIGGDI